MKVYTATEQAYKNGYAKGYEDGKSDATEHGEWMPHSKDCRRCSNCGIVRNIYSQLGWEYCPNCGKKNL